MPAIPKIDPLATSRRAFIDPESFVTRDGREYLYRADLSNRRRDVFERSGGFCERIGCNRCITAQTMKLHHKKARVKGGAENMDNLLALCRRCDRHMNRWSRS
jgi:5-methylcytosine-specific restriction endonuclease McrA